MERKTVHIISHSHWDREWYMPFEKFRIRLVDLMTKTFGLLEADEGGFKFFHMDGQVIPADDYLEIYPEQSDRIRKLVRSGRLFVGPWYILQDAFLTSGEAQIRNMQLGLRRAEQLGGATMIGYFPDTFGNISQSAQLLREFDIDTAVFGRGINAVAENNTVVNDGKAGGANSELWWEAPDGSRVLSIFMANWYHNGMELPTDPEKAKERARSMIANAEKFATTSHLLLMNGCDHQPVQVNVGEAIRTLNEVVPGYHFVHSNFPMYLRMVREQERDWKTIKGELTSEYTNGWTTLVNTASSRMYLKQWNVRVQTELERWVEPFSAIAWILGEEYPEALVRHAWKLLLQNHAHDSICGCSVDEVHNEMMTRFHKSYQISETLSGKALEVISGLVDTSAVCSDEGEICSTEPFRTAIVVFNPLGWERHDWVRSMIDSDSELNIREYRLYDWEGNEVPFEWEDLGAVHGFTLPDDGFRIKWEKHRYQLSFYAKNVPSIGFATFIFKPRKAQELSMVSGTPEFGAMEKCLENSYLRVEVHEDGSLDVTDKGNGKTFREVLIFEDSGDVGNEYMYVGTCSGTITTKGTKARVEVISTGIRKQLRIIHDLAVPAKREDKECSKELVSLHIEVLLGLNADSKRLDADVRINNTAKNHRLRVLFPSELETGTVYADAPFDVVAREIEPWEGWTNPSRCERMQNFFALTDGRNGLMIAAEGLPEYEILRDGRNTMALTLLRCVGELGDWNYFPTSDSQCPGPFAARFSIIPLSADYTKGIQEAYAFNVPLRAVETGIHPGTITPRQSWASVSSPSTVVTALQKADTYEGLQLRFVNLAQEAETVEVSGDLLSKAQLVRERQINEKAIRDLSQAGGKIHVAVPAKDIMTLGLQFDERKS